jgi:Na+/pantothenate symporter
LFLVLGGLLYLYTTSKGAAYADVMVNGKMVKQLVLNGNNILGDKMFPSVAMKMLPPAISIMFIIALISALFPSADGALTALTSSFCIDMLDLQKRTDIDEKAKKQLRLTVHFTFTFVFLACIWVFYKIADNSIIDKILDLAGYTYGPLLGLFAFGIFTKRSLNNSIIITVICLLAPVICYLINMFSPQLFGSYKIGIELLPINGAITFLGLLLISKKDSSKANISL